jgi:hypothetical protein
MFLRIAMFREVVLWSRKVECSRLFFRSPMEILYNHPRDCMCCIAAMSRSIPSSVPRIAPNLTASQYALIRDMIVDGSPSDDEMAKLAHYSYRTIRSSRADLLRFGSTTIPYNGRGGRPRSIDHSSDARSVIAVVGAGWVFGQGLDYPPVCQA